MDHVKILKRAANITWNDRALWLFGALIALTTSGGGGTGYQFDRNDPGPFQNWRGFEDWEGWQDFRYLDLELTPELRTTIIIGVALFVAFIALMVLTSIIAKYVAETAVIRMVNDYEETGEKVGIRQGFRLGWSQSAFRLFLIDLVVGLPVAVVFILLFAITGLPLLGWVSGNTAFGVTGTVATVGMWVLLIILVIVVGAALSLLMHFFRRVSVLEDRGVVDSIRTGYQVVRNNLQDVLTMWLIMIGLGLAWLVIFVPLAIIMVPVIIIFALLGGIVGGIPALVVGLITGLFLEGAAPYIIGVLFGLPLFFLVVALPLLFVGGLVEIFKSSTWTLTYREVRVLGKNGLTLAAEETAGETMDEETPESDDETDGPEDTVE